MPFLPQRMPQLPLPPKEEMPPKVRYPSPSPQLFTMVIAFYHGRDFYHSGLDASASNYWLSYLSDFVNRLSKMPNDAHGGNSQGFRSCSDYDASASNSCFLSNFFIWLRKTRVSKMPYRGCCTGRGNGGAVDGHGLPGERVQKSGCGCQQCVSRLVACVACFGGDSCCASFVRRGSRLFVCAVRLVWLIWWRTCCTSRVV